MTEQLGYAAPVPRYRRASFVALITLPVLIASYILAVPKIRTFRDHQSRRAEVRRQFESELSTARGAMEASNLDCAAAALFKAEFPTRIERHLFGRSAVADFEQRLSGVRAWIDQAAARRREEAERQARQAEMRRKQEEEDERRHGIYTIRCYGADRSLVVARLHDRAAVVLRTGNNQQAFRICEQIVVLDPGHRFDAQFWGNVQQKP